MYICLHVKYLLFLSDFNETCFLWKDFLEILRYQILWKSAQWEASCSTRTDRHDEATNRLSSFRLQGCYKRRHYAIASGDGVTSQSTLIFNVTGVGKLCLTFYHKPSALHSVAVLKPFSSHIILYHLIITVLDWKCATKRNERTWNGISL